MDNGHEHQIPIWFFIGALLAVYGVLILGYGLIYYRAEQNVKLAYLHANIWWGALLTVMGLIFLIRSRPGKK
jgi:hypothetical protein